MATKLPAIPNYNNLTSLRRAVRESPLLAELLRHHQYIGKDRQINDDKLMRVRITYKGKATSELIQQVLEDHATNITISQKADGREIRASFCTTPQKLTAIQKHLQGIGEKISLPPLPPDRPRPLGARTHICGKGLNRNDYPRLELNIAVHPADTGVPLPTGYYGQPYQPPEAWEPPSPPAPQQSERPRPTLSIVE